MRPLRSWGNVWMSLAALALVLGALALPLWQYADSTPRRVPEGGFHDPDVDGIVTHEEDFYAGRYEGDAPPTDAARADVLVERAFLALVGAAALFALSLATELPGLGRVPAGVRMALSLLGTGAVAAALAITWFQLPATMSGHNVQDVFTSVRVNDPPSYVRTTLGFGWIAGAFAVPAGLAAALFRFQAGSEEMAWKLGRTGAIHGNEPT